MDRLINYKQGRAIEIGGAKALVYMDILYIY